MAKLDQRALAIVEDCLELDAGARADFVAQACRGAPTLRGKVEQMLAMDQTRFKLLPTELADAPEAGPEPIPKRIGNFRVTGLIGTGGMGTVVAAERDDGIYRQKVAIKLIRAGLKDEGAAARFALERRILARLDHPGIARILDGGATDGRPYLVMEHVAGEPVTAALERQGGGLDAALDRFEAVCEAVSHAHRNLVVHADIKPSNVLATESGAIKLVDFGVARITAELDADEVEGPYPLTKGYAAPERIAGGPPTIAGDVYSLGALLHEMLTGERPDGRPASEVARTGGRDDWKRLQPDLDAILTRALAPEPADRYPDVAGLVEDIRRFRAVRPVSPLRHRRGYRVARFLRRNRLVIALGGVVFVLLSAATMISLVLYGDARQQRAAAEARFGEVRSLAKFQLFGLYDLLQPVPGSLAARERMAVRAQTYLDRLAAVPGAPDALRIETAAGYNRLAEIQGVPTRPNIGAPEAARTNLRRAWTMLAPLPPNPAADRERARALLMAADLAMWQDNQAGQGERLLLRAEPLVARARDGSKAWLELENYRRTLRLDMLGWRERYAEESAFARDTLRWLNALPRPTRRELTFLIAAAEALNAHAEGVWYLGDQQTALVDARAADAIVRAGLALYPDRAEMLSARVASGYNLITTLELMGSAEDLLPLSLEIMALAARLRALEPNDQAIAWRARNAESLAAQLLSQAGRSREAIAIQQGIAARDAARLAARPGDTRTARDLAFDRKVLGSLLWEAGRRGEACRTWRASGVMFDRLQSSGKLNAWDKSHVVAGLKGFLRICTGEAPASSYSA